MMYRLRTFQKHTQSIAQAAIRSCDSSMRRAFSCCAHAARPRDQRLRLRALARRIW